MPKVERKRRLETEEHPYVIEYECVCGEKIIYHCDEMPKKLIKCFNEYFELFGDCI